MDFKKLAVFIRVLGLIVLGYGAFQWSQNQPEIYQAPPAAKNDGSVGGFFDALEAQRNNLGAPERCQEANVRHAEERDKAVKIMIAGGVILFVGFSISSSTKKSPSA